MEKQAQQHGENVREYKESESWVKNKVEQSLDSYDIRGESQPRMKKIKRRSGVERGRLVTLTPWFLCYLWKL